MFITPEYLKPGDTIGIVAPARKISLKEIELAIEIFESWGLKVKTGKSLFGEFHQFSGTDIERTDDFNSMLHDDKVKAIICARGGYGTMRIIDNIDFAQLIRKPKWIVGYSDITVLHSHISKNCNIETIHSTMPINFGNNPDSQKSIESLRNALLGNKLSYSFNGNSFNRKGIATGRLTGGNLSILFALKATPSDIDYRDTILFIEDIDEYLYHIDRIMLNLKRSGSFNELKGMIVGGMTGMNDNEIPFGLSANEIIRNTVEEFDFPVCYGLPAGHDPLNLALIIGRQIELIVQGNTQIYFK